jgi:hypothetical protein
MDPRIRIHTKNVMDPQHRYGTGKYRYVRLYLDHKTSAYGLRATINIYKHLREITIAGSPRCLEDGIAGHNPGSLAELCGAGRKGDINRAGIAAGDAHLDGAAPRVDLLVNAHLAPGLAIKNPKKPNKNVFFGGFFKV